jgi:hypothetical protein
VNLDDPTTTTLAVAEVLSRAGVRAAVYGGLALAAYGTPRETKDADFAVVEANADQVAAALVAAGLSASVTFDSVVFGGNTVTRIALLGGDGVSGFNVADLVRPRVPRYARVVLDRSLEGTLREQEVTIVSPEDFIILNVLSTRDRDVEDAHSAVAALGGELDAMLIEREIDLLSAELPDHDVRGRFGRVREAGWPGGG